MKYFSHETNARNDSKLLKLRVRYGMEGYGLYFALVEIMYSESDYNLGFDDETLNAIAFELHPSIDLKKFVEDCITYGLFVSDGKAFWSEGLKRRADCLERKQKSAINAAKARWNKKDETTPDDPLSPVDDGWKRFVTAWEVNGYGMFPNPASKLGSDLDSYYGEFGADIMIFGIETAAPKSRSPQYLLKILNNWSEAGVKTVNDAKAESNRFRAATTRQQPTNDNPLLINPKWF